MSWMEVSVVGAGTLSFSWKVDCEWDESGACTWDRLMYFVDGADKDENRIDGFTDWDSKSVTFTSGGTHTVRWVYFKDDYDEEDATCEDCGWVDGIVWAPLTVVEPIPELPSSASAAEGAFDFTVSVKDVAVGSGATDANLKKVFGLGGTAQLGVEEFDPDRVALEFGTPVNGKLKFTASPKDKTAKSFFMKMKVR